MKKLVVASAVAVLLAVSSCSSEPIPKSDEQKDCQIADELLPSLRDMQEGALSGAELQSAEEAVTDSINNELSSMGQVSAMVYVLSNPDDQATFDDFTRQLVDYCEDFAGWEMTNK